MNTRCERRSCWPQTSDNRPGEEMTVLRSLQRESSNRPWESSALLCEDGQQQSQEAVEAETQTSLPLGELQKGSDWPLIWRCELGTQTRDESVVGGPHSQPRYLFGQLRGIREDMDSVPVPSLDTGTETKACWSSNEQRK
jgi:hypothetical protein